MRRAGKVDLNQQEIVKALRAIGATVWITSNLGKGAPDLVVGYHGKNYLMEVKQEKGQLTEDEKQFHWAWQGQINIVRSSYDAVYLVSELDGTY